MTPSLRRAHQTIWTLLAIALPLGFVAALRSVTATPLQEPVGRLPPAPLPIQVRSVATDSLVVTLRRAVRATDWQLDIVVRKPVEVSTSVEIGRQGGWQTVGLLNAPGVYRFALPASDTLPQVRLVDNLHHQLLKTISF